MSTVVKKAECRAKVVWPPRSMGELVAWYEDLREMQARFAKLGRLTPERQVILTAKMDRTFQREAIWLRALEAGMAEG